MVEFGDAVSCEGVEVGTCVVMKAGELVYAGPISVMAKKLKSKSLGGSELFLNPVDFNDFSEFLKRKKASGSGRLS